MMTMNKLVKQLSKNMTEFKHQNQIDKAFACAELLSIIETKGYKDIKGDIYSFSV